MQGFEFNLMVLGESGLGKSSLINSMFWTQLMTKDAEQDQVQEREGGILRRRAILQEGEVSEMYTLYIIHILWHPFHKRVPLTCK